MTRSKMTNAAVEDTTILADTTSHFTAASQATTYRMQADLRLCSLTLDTEQRLSWASVKQCLVQYTVYNIIKLEMVSKICRTKTYLYLFSVKLSDELGLSCTRNWHNILICEIFEGNCNTSNVSLPLDHVASIVLATVQVEQAGSRYGRSLGECNTIRLVRWIRIKTALAILFSNQHQ